MSSSAVYEDNLLYQWAVPAKIVVHAGIEGQRLMHVLKQGNLSADEVVAPALLANLPILPDRQAAIEHRLR